MTLYTHTNTPLESTVANRLFEFVLFKYVNQFVFISCSADRLMAWNFFDEILYFTENK